MLRHEFQPGRLVAGAFLTVAGIAYIGDANDAWETPWFAVIPLVVCGLLLAGVTALLTRAIRKRRRSAGTQQTPTPPPRPETHD